MKPTFGDTSLFMVPDAAYPRIFSELPEFDDDVVH